MWMWFHCATVPIMVTLPNGTHEQSEFHWIVNSCAKSAFNLLKMAKNDKYFPAAPLMPDNYHFALALSAATIRPNESKRWQPIRDCILYAPLRSFGPLLFFGWPLSLLTPAKLIKFRNNYVRCVNTIFTWLSISPYSLIDWKKFGVWIWMTWAARNYYYFIDIRYRKSESVDSVRWMGLAFQKRF